MHVFSSNTNDKLLYRKPEKRYPTETTTTQLVNNFVNFFHVRRIIR
jgi:hypothetical protein